MLCVAPFMEPQKILTPEVGQIGVRERALHRRHVGAVHVAPAVDAKGSVQPGKIRRFPEIEVPLNHLFEWDCAL